MALIDLLDDLNLKGRPKGDNYSCLCPFHNESRPSFGVELVPPYRYGCFACHEVGNIVKLIMKLTGVPFEAARKQVARHVVYDFEPISDMEAMPSDPDKAAVWFYQYQFDKYKLPSRYLRRRGVNPKVARRFSVGYDPAHKMLVFPLTNVFTGTVGGFAKRKCEEGANAKILEEKRQSLLFLSPNYRKAHELFVSEGTFDGLACWRERRNLGFPSAAVASLCTSSPTAEQWTFILEFPVVIWALDNDAAGQATMDRIEARNDVKGRHYRLEYDTKDPGTRGAHFIGVVPLRNIQHTRLPSYLR